MIARRNWNDDEALLLDVGDALRPEPGEQAVIDAARGVYAWHHTELDRGLAALLYDSHLDEAVSVRGPVSGAPRNLVFTLGELRVEIEVSDTGIEGQLVPPEPGTVRLLGAAGILDETTTDEVGCFTFPSAGHRGPIRIECAVAGRQLATEWINA